MSEYSSSTQYWFNTETGQVETAKEKSSWTHLLGPYATREEAQHALDNAARRNEEWEAEDEDWRR
ncbi:MULTISPECIES: SPOR domain-containing protein [Isoptericola]|uniref:SPOR domain-containing protein n=1 Tax=Isoptericola sediminis TaxID=2733572 RepID=A0A849JYZ5_9MICO|nr:MULTISPECIES: SPOR domain-containing protein [Isoptericola]MDO8145263.1 SPOR domain-containing protein [Isoptericola sp. 178]MDO8148899.1 SPOR domain-containing protein [Isoptericola sp. b515]MDO8151158.1 SPOR domain-containing protein [Isoptericola sp. b408]NNU28502.1 SPOR domain-containing protein [Isoptericola sediminis]